MNPVDADLYRRLEAFLEPGDVELNGVIVHTDLGSDEDLEMHELTVELNEVIAEHAGVGESYIYAGNDDEEFASNQFQGRTLDDDAFVWECQQLLRDGTFDLVFYYESSADHVGIVEAVEERGFRATGVRTDGGDERDDAPEA
ncbi:MAG: DUF5778 family protein [Haloferacaceae archaeon]